MPLSQKVIKMFFRIMKPHLCSRPCMILKRLDENCSRCNLKLLSIIPLFQNFKNLPKIMRPSHQAQALMLMYYRRAQHDFKTIE